MAGSMLYSLAQASTPVEVQILQAEARAMFSHGEPTTTPSLHEIERGLGLNNTDGCRAHS